MGRGGVASPPSEDPLEGLKSLLKPFNQSTTLASACSLEETLGRQRKQQILDGYYQAPWIFLLVWGITM